MMSVKLWFVTVSHVSLIYQVFVSGVANLCNSRGSIDSKALKDHTFESFKVTSPYECLVLCENDQRCQSYNYVIQGTICELNNRTKDARPEKFVTDPDRFYMTRVNRAPLGSTPEIPAESCREIKASEGGQAISRLYWLRQADFHQSSLGYCDMQTEEADYCKENPCQNNGTCVNSFVGYTCLCELYWYGNLCETDCSSALGMENLRIPSSSVKASSTLSQDLQADNGRLNFLPTSVNSGAWAAGSSDQQQWFQVDFGNWTTVSKISTQGRQDEAEWVETYTVSYSYDGLLFREYKEDGQNTKVWPLREHKVFQGNNDSNTILSQPLMKPLLTRFIRIVPVSWNGWISLRTEFFGCQKGTEIPDLECVNPLGVQSGTIADSCIVATSSADEFSGPERGRLKNTMDGDYLGGWCSKYNDLKQYLQIDLGNVTKVTGIAAQGHNDLSRWIKKYMLAYSNDGATFLLYNNAKELQGNWDSGTIQGNFLDPPIVARFIQIRPISWNYDICLRMELYGCSTGFITPICTEALGMQNGQILNSNITASSALSAVAPHQGRLHNIQGSACWIAATANIYQWLQIEFGNWTAVTGVAVQGRPNANQWVKSFSISHGYNNIYFFIKDETGQNKIFVGNTDRYTVVRHYLETLVIVQYIRIHPVTWYGYISMRAEFYGCRKGFETQLTCRYPLGMESGEIPTPSIAVSSRFSHLYDAEQARLHIGSAWVAAKPNDKQFLQVDLGNITQVTAVTTQGRSTSNQWVTGYSVCYSLDGGNFTSYKNNVVFPGNNDRETVVGHLLQPPIIARFVRIQVKAFYSNIAMRLELYGCRAGFPLPEISVCLEALGMQNKRIPDSAITASSQFHISTWAAFLARLHLVTGSWLAGTNTEFQWLQVDFSEWTQVNRVAIQGRYNYNSWVDSFGLVYGYDGVFFKEYMENGLFKVFFEDSSDPYTAIIHNLKEEIISRYIRILPITWTVQISIRAEFYGCTSGFEIPVLECITPLGLKSGEIPDQAITSSSAYNLYHGPERARLDTVKNGSYAGGWRPKLSNLGQWIQVDLGRITKITRIATQGYLGVSYWVTTYTISYSLDGGPFVAHAQTIRGNEDTDTTVGIILSPAIITRFLRIHPKTWRSHIGMRFELYGCVHGFLVPEVHECYKALGMQSGLIPDSSITVSSGSASHARLHLQGGSWMPQNNQFQWLQVSLGNWTKVRWVAVQGRHDIYSRYVTYFSISFSHDGIFFEDYKEEGTKKVFEGGVTNQYQVGYHSLNDGVITRYVRINPEAWQGSIAMRVEFYGCTDGIQPLVIECAEPLGMKDGTIPNHAITASSVYDAYQGPERARLETVKEGNNLGAWRPLYNDGGQWIQVDLENITKITAIATQGRQDYSFWVTSYSISYSIDEGPFMHYSKYQVIKANADRDSLRGHKFSPPLIARFVRIHPKTWNVAISMRFELYGCRTGYITPEPRECLSSLGMQDETISDSAVSASSIFSSLYWAANARLHYQGESGRQGTWMVYDNDLFQWLQINLTKWTKVNGVAIQGSKVDDKWVTSFRLSYSRDGVFFEDHMENGTRKVFPGSNNRYEVVSHFLPNEIVTRYIRFHPLSWNVRISMRVELYGCAEDSIPSLEDCISPLGMKDGTIPDQAITASTIINQYYRAERARLDTVTHGSYFGAWAAKYNDLGQWIQVDMGNITKITQIATQGRQDSSQWVKSYSITYSVHGEPFVAYRNAETLLGNNDKNSLSGTALNPPIVARYFRIHPREKKTHMSMRFELYGCRDGYPIPTQPKCLEALGMQYDDMIPDSAIVASSEYSTSFKAYYARLHFDRVWVSRTKSTFQWLQVNLSTWTNVTAVAIQGRRDADNWITSFRLTHSRDGLFFEDYKENGVRKVFSGVSDRYSVVSHILQEGIITRLLRIHPLTWHLSIAMRAELYGCKEVLAPPVTECISSLGMKNKEIQDERITASSVYNQYFVPQLARLDTVKEGSYAGAWRPKYDAEGQWIQVDFGEITMVKQISTQGRQDASSWVTSYTISYSLYGGPFVFYNNRQVFDGNVDKNSIVGHVINPPITADKIRINPDTWYAAITMRFELYGCRDGFPIPEAPSCLVQLGMQYGLVSDHLLSASSEYSSGNEAKNARLHFDGGWRAAENNFLQWLQVDFGEEKNITQVATQGYSTNWIRSYKLSYSIDGPRFIQYQAESGVTMIFTGNIDAFNVVHNELNPLVRARVVRLLPMSWERNIAMRTEFYGC